MTIRRLEHYNLRTVKFDETVRFYVDVLGMRVDRPPMAPADFPATWIFDASDVAAIHLTPVDPANPQESYANMVQYQGGPDKNYPPSFRGSGAVDHVAFECSDYDDMIARIKTLEIPFAENHVPQINLRQVFIRDPNGVTVELNFR